MRLPAENRKAIVRQLPSSDPSDVKPWVVSSRGLVAEFFGVSTQTVKDWKSNGMPGTSGKWDLKAIRTWQDLRRDENAQIVGDTFAPIRGEILKEDHRRKKLKNDELSSQLVSVADVRRSVAAWAVKLRLRIMSIPADLVLIVPGELKSVVKAKSDNVVRLALKEASDTKLVGCDVGQMIIDEAERLKHKSESST